MAGALGQRSLDSLPWNLCGVRRLVPPRERSIAVASKPERPIVTYQAKERKTAPAPEEVPIMHSSTFILKDKKHSAAYAAAIVDSDNEHSPTSGSSESDMSDNAFQWALRQADAYFDKVEHDSSSGSTSARALVQNPASQATMKTMQGVTTFGAAAAPQIMKVAVPFGKKVLSASADVLIAGIGAMNDAARKKKEKDKVERGRHNGSDRNGSSADS